MNIGTPYMNHPIIKRRIVTKVFPNSVGGWHMARLYAKENNYEMLTTPDTFLSQNIQPLPDFYYFTFMTN